MVISPAKFTENTGFAVVLPASLPVTGEILISHIRSVDIPARPVRYAGATIGPEVARFVRAKLNAIITI